MSPITTGPAGTSGLNDGTGALPITFIACWAANQVAHAADRTVAIASCSDSWCLSGSSFLRPLSSASVIACFIAIGVTIDATIGEMQVISGTGMFGIGVAIGPGNSVNSGYHGSPGTVTLLCQ